MLVAGFITLWVAIDRGSPGRYDTFFNFVAYTTAEFNEFEAVRWTGSGGKLKLDGNGKPVEVTVKFKRTAGGKDGEVSGRGEQHPVPDERQHGHRRAVHDRCDSREGAGRRGTGARTTRPLRRTRERRRRCTPRSRGSTRRRAAATSKAHQIGTLFIPSTGTVAGALALNFVLFVVWLVAFWPLLRFSFTHALVFTAAFATLTMLGVMPLLFKQNRDRKPPPAPAPAAIWSWTGRCVA